MSNDDVVEVADEAIEKGAEAAKGMAKFIPLFINVSGGMVALTASIAAGSMALGKFRAAYEASRKSA